jgi:hypothetical protein
MKILKIIFSLLISTSASSANPTSKLTFTSVAQGGGVLESEAEKFAAIYTEDILEAMLKIENHNKIEDLAFRWCNLEKLSSDGEKFSQFCTELKRFENLRLFHIRETLCEMSKEKLFTLLSTLENLPHLTTVTIYGSIKNDINRWNELRHKDGTLAIWNPFWDDDCLPAFEIHKQLLEETDCLGPHGCYDDADKEIIEIYWKSLAEAMGIAGFKACEKGTWIRKKTL